MLDVTVVQFHGHHSNGQRPPQEPGGTDLPRQLHGSLSSSRDRFDGKWVKIRSSLAFTLGRQDVFARLGAAEVEGDGQKRARIVAHGNCLRAGNSILSTFIRCDHDEVVAWIAQPRKDEFKFHQGGGE